MKMFKIGDKEFNVMTNWNEVTLSQFINFMKLEENKNKNMNDLEQIIYMMRVIEILSGCKENEMDDLPLESLGDLMTELQPLLTSKPEFKQEKKIDIEGITYIFKDFQKLSMGELISFKTLQQREPGLDSLPKLLAIICRPATLANGIYEIEKFNADIINERADMFLKQPALGLMGTANFFLNGKIQLKENLVQSSKVKKARKKSLK